MTWSILLMRSLCPHPARTSDIPKWHSPRADAYTVPLFLPLPGDVPYCSYGGSPGRCPYLSALQHWQQITLFYERCYFSHLTCARMIPTLTIGSSIIVISNLQYRIHWQSKINVSGTHNLVRLTKNTGWHSNTSLIEKFNPPCQKQVDCVKWRHSHYHRRGRSVALLLLLNWFSWQNKHYITVKL